MYDIFLVYVTPCLFPGDVYRFTFDNHWNVLGKSTGPTLSWVNFT